MKRILLIDDDAADRLLYQRFLAPREGFASLEIVEAATGEEGLALFRSQPPDCVLLDYKLPDTDGLALLEILLRETAPDTLCVVMITGRGSERLAVRALNSGALDYLVKQQFDRDSLYKTVVHAIEKNEWRQYMGRYQGEVQGANHQLRESLAELTKARRALDESHAETLARNQQLARTNQDLDNFVYTASHDLKAPITNLEGLLTALREDLGPSATVPGVTHLLALMLGAIERFKRTLDDLTDIAKLHDAHHAPATTVDLAALVEGVRLDLAPLLAATGGQLTVDVAPCPHLAFAERNLRSVVYNLLSNALKYHHPDRVPHVRVCCRSTPAATVLEVQDNGLGLDPDQQAKLFGLFQRLHDHVEGSGVGLYMVKKIVEGVGGRLEVESQPGVGSTFRVFLPR